MKKTSTYCQFALFTIAFFFHSSLFCQVQIGNAINAPSTWDYVGASMSFSGNGDRVAFGVPSSPNQGEVRVYDLINDEWVFQEDSITGPISNINNFFGGSVSLSDDGNILAIGSQTNGSQDPFVKVYKYTNGEWVKLAEDIFISNPAILGALYVSISGDGQRVFIGNPSNNTPNVEGSVSVFEFTGSNWMPLGNIIVGEHIDDQFGRSVSASFEGNRVAIGGYRNEENGESAGHVRVFELDNDQQNWTQIGEDLDGDEAKDFFGFSLSLSDGGNKLAVGAPTEYDLSPAKFGYAKTYIFDGSNWTQFGDTFWGENEGDRTGCSVSLSSNGKVLALGASDASDEFGTTLPGSAKLFQLDDQNQWNQDGPTIYGENDEDSFGFTVALSSSGHRVAIGATENDDAFFNGGQITVFEAVFMETSAVSSEPNSRLELYPNPTSNIVNISGLNLNERQIKITSAEGILMKSYTTNKNHIDLQGFTPGVYFISVLTQEGWRTEMIFKD